MGFIEMRKKSGLSQYEVAKALKINQSSVSYWETGVNMPTTKRLAQLAKLYGCSIDDLLKEERK